MQIDNSRAWAKENGGGKDCTRALVRQDLHALWLSGDYANDGILGDDFVRLQVYIGAVRRDARDPGLYHVRGKSRTRRKIVCAFTGTIRLQRAGELPLDPSLPPGPNNPRHGILTAEYQFSEDSKQNGAGLYRGVVATFWMYDARGKVVLDDRDWGADGYQNNTFVGTWTSHRTGIRKRCLWGDDRLPYVSGFDIGDGEIVVAPRYRRNGWESYGADTERNDRWWR